MSNQQHNDVDADMLRRAAEAVRNLIESVPNGRGEWALWVPLHLDQRAEQLDPTVVCEYGYAECPGGSSCAMNEHYLYPSGGPYPTATDASTPDNVETP